MNRLDLKNTAGNICVWKIICMQGETVGGREGRREGGRVGWVSEIPAFRCDIRNNPELQSLNCVCSFPFFGTNQ